MPSSKSHSYRSLLLATFMLSLLVQPALAEIYKWTDANGKVHYSDKAPKTKSRKTETIDIDVSEQKIDPQMEDFRRRNRRLIEVWDGERAENKKQLAKESETKKKRARACESLRKRLAFSRKSAALYVPQADGERSFYSDEQKSAYEEKMKRLLGKHCR